MDRHTRRWLRSGLALGTALAGAAYCWRRFRRSSSDHEPKPESDPITERHSAAFLVRRGIDPARTEDVRDVVERQNGESEDDWLLTVDDASTASLFFDWNGDEPELVWYVEVPWTVVESWDRDPTATLSDAVPVVHEAVRDVEDVDEPVDRELLVHAVHPSRPRTTIAADAASGRPETGGRAANEDVPSVDVELVRLDLESGFPERFADRFAGLSRRAIDGELQLNRIESWSVDMLDAEDMYTESVFLERRTDGYSLVAYMETASMAGVYDAYYDTWNPVARGSEIVLGHVLVDPDVILSYPLDTNTELLAHATNPSRPRDASACRRSAREPSTE